jgi:hypothetical protein
MLCKAAPEASLLALCLPALNSHVGNIVHIHLIHALAVAAGCALDA